MSVECLLLFLLTLAAAFGRFAVHSPIYFNEEVFAAILGYCMFSFHSIINAAEEHPTYRLLHHSRFRMGTPLMRFVNQVFAAAGTLVMLAIVHTEIRAAEAIDPSTVTLETSLFRHMAIIWLGTILNAGAVFRSLTEQMKQPLTPYLK